jgi:putative endonuclease
MATSVTGGMTSIVRALLNRLLGDRGERAAARHLKRHGMRVLLRGYRTKQGEIDLIARDGNTLVFVEVKSRRYGVPAEAVTPEKQRRLTMAALHFLRRHQLLEVRSRFDVVAIVWPDDRSPPQIEHFPNAFEPIGRGQMFR